MPETSQTDFVAPAHSVRSLTKGTRQYILSNTHVFAGDFVSGGNSDVASAGDPINQAGLIDVGCQDRPADYRGDPL